MANNFSHRGWANKVYNPDIVSKSEPDWTTAETTGEANFYLAGVRSKLARRTR